jgi:hypothetical protein
MIKREILKTQKITIKGKIVKIDEEGISVLDKKTEEVDIVDYSMFEDFIGKNISMVITDSKKEEVMNLESDVEEEEENEGEDEE